MLNGEDIPLVKIIDQETLDNYFIPQFLLDGLDSTDLNTFKFANEVWVTLTGRVGSTYFLIENLRWLFIQAINIESLKVPEENQIKLFNEEIQKGQKYHFPFVNFDTHNPIEYTNFIKKIKNERLYFYDNYWDWDRDKIIEIVVNQLSIIRVLLGESQKFNKNFEYFFEFLFYIILKFEINDGNENYLIKNNSIKNIRSNYSDKGIHFSVEVMNQIRSYELSHLLFQNCILNLKLMEQLGTNYILPFGIYTDLFSNPEGKFFRGLINLFRLTGSGLEKKSYLAAILHQYLRFKIPELNANARGKPDLTNYIINHIRLFLNY